MQNNQSNYLRHEKLRVWHEAMALVGLVAKERIMDAELRDQATRAVKSVALNVAEGASRNQRSAANHFGIARGSAGEVAAAYQVAAAFGETVDVESVRAVAARVAAMLGALVKAT